MRGTQPQPGSDQDEPGRYVPPFALDVSSGRRASTVTVTGEIDAASAPGVGDALVGAIDGDRPVHLDLAGTTFIDSAGIRVLVRSMWRVKDAGSSLTVVALSPLAENILRITGILDVLKDPTP